MSHPSTQPTFVTLHRLGELSEKPRGTLLLGMRDAELLPDAYLDLGGRLHPLFVATRTSDLKRLPSRTRPRLPSAATRLCGSSEP